MSKIKNFYEIMPKDLIPKSYNPNKEDHHFELPFRMCIVAPSGSGKTNFLLNLISLFSKGKGTFSSIDIITKIAKEPLYDFLKLQSESIQIKEGLTNTPQLDKFDKDENHLVVFDDLVLSKNLEIVENYYIRCRKFNVSVIFISQSYYAIPTMIRKNTNYMIILKLGSGQREVKMICAELGGRMDKDQLLNMYEYCTNEKFCPLIVDMEQQTNINRRFRKGFSEWINVEDFKE
jgi:DNA helicase HerA-like ATPase